MRVSRRSGNIVGAVALLYCLFGIGSALAADEGQIVRGKYLATAADCEACHTVPEGRPFAGGLPIESPLGTIYSTNITSSKKYGIGGYSIEQFSQALRNGIRGDGTHLYPAMPYASYAKLTDEDIESLYVYFMGAVAAVDTPPKTKTSLPFPYSLRFSMAFWNALFLDPEPYHQDPRMSSEWNRGKYLVQGAAHCGEWHTARGFFMQQERSQQFGGAVIGSWYAPNITPDDRAGIGTLSDDELFRYLKFGKIDGKAQAGGEMALAVQLSLSKLTDVDIRSMVVYVRSLPKVSDSNAKLKFDQGHATTDVASFRGVGGTSFENSLPGDAAQSFSANCSTCHGFRADGTKDRYFPSLFHNSALATGEGRNLVATILFGINRTTPEGLAFMPGFGGKPTDIADLSNDQVAELANYLLHTYGDANLKVTPRLVQNVRDGRAPTPALVLLVTVAEWAVGAPIATLLLWTLWRRSHRKHSRRLSHEA